MGGAAHSAVETRQLCCAMMMHAAWLSLHWLCAVCVAMCRLSKLAAWLVMGWAVGELLLR